MITMKQFENIEDKERRERLRSFFALLALGEDWSNPDDVVVKCVLAGSSKGAPHEISDKLEELLQRMNFLARRLRNFSVDVTYDYTEEGHEYSETIDYVVRAETPSEAEAAARELAQEEEDSGWTTFDIVFAEATEI